MTPPFIEMSILSNYCFNVIFYDLGWYLLKCSWLVPFECSPASTDSSIELLNEMINFYKNNHKIQVQQALVEAQKSLINSLKWLQPKYWAGFEYWI